MQNQGLSQKEAARKLQQHGLNELAVKKAVTAAEILFDQFKSPLIYILLIAMVITGGVLRDIKDTIVIGLAVGVNTLLGFIQERKANRSLEALSLFLQPKAKVKRDGRWQEIDAKLIVPGDVIRLELGVKVSADGKITQDGSLSLNEAILTGESMSVAKKVDDDVFMGTTVAAGIGEMIAAKTGQATRFGAIATNLKQTKEGATPLQKQISGLAKVMAWVVLIISVLVVVIGRSRGISVAEIFPTGVALAVSAIPEGLAVSLTAILALGMQRILKRKALVRKLIAAETLGSVTVICADKTGTLTEGKMRVVKALTDDEPMLAKTAVLCNDMRDPLEIAMMDWAKEKYTGSEKRLDAIPFDHKRKYIATLYPGLLLVSGAPEIVLEKCRRPNFKLETLSAEAKKSHRLVGFAYKKFGGKAVSHADIKDLTWLGVLVYEDPIREGVKDVLSKARKAGIKVKLITGDYKETAVAVAGQLGIDPKDVYSRVTPEEKLDIVRKLQEKGEVVAMTGDGVNDAPALKKADIGIVVSEASDVAKETADMVLLDNNFGTIVAAIEEGRMIQDNLKKVILYLLSDSFGEVIIVVLSIIAATPLAITAGMILWINLISDGLPNLALTIEPKEDNLLLRRPQKNTSLLSGEMKLMVGLISTVSAFMAFAAFWYYWHHPAYGLIEARSVAFSILGLNSLFYVWSVRSLSRPVWHDHFFKNPWLITAVIIGLGLQLIALYTPFGRDLLGTVALDVNEWLIVVVASLSMLVIVESFKRRWHYSA
jgi:Ca2+-transporting ATPase